MPCYRSTVRDSARQEVAAVLLLLFSAAAAASPPCVAAAAQRFALPAPLLRAVVQQESSGRCTARHPRNADGSHDIGCAGINSRWLPELTRRFGITEQDLLAPCTNIHVGAWVLAHSIRRHGNTWRAVGAYNAGTESKRMTYSWKIVTRMRQDIAQ